jgi:hypothetical protein
MCELQPGDPVVCVDGRPNLPHAPAVLVVGRSYKVEAVIPSGEHTYITLVGVRACAGWGYRHQRFRKATDRNITAWLTQAVGIEEPRRDRVKP